MENVIARDGEDEELSLFLEMRRREKFQGVSSSIPELGRNGVEKTSTKSLELTTTSCVKVRRRSAVEKFLDSENNKSDYEWLLAAPETLDEKENSMVKPKEPKAGSTALKPRVENIWQEPVTRSLKALKPIPRLNSSTTVSKQANTVVEPKPNSKPSRQATPTSRTTRQTNSARNSNPDSKTSSIKSASASITRSSSVGKSVPSAKSKSLTTPETHARPVSASRGRSTGRSSKISNDVNPVLMGTQMVERVVNMRKLPPPKQDDKMSSSFGRTLSRSSLDMALRHMNIRRSVSGNLRVTINAPKIFMDKNESSPSS